MVITFFSLVYDFPGKMENRDLIAPSNNSAGHCSPRFSRNINGTAAGKFDITNCSSISLAVIMAHCQPRFFITLEIQNRLRW